MSTTRVVFIIVCIVLGAVIFAVGTVIQRNGNGGVSSVKSLFDPRARAARQKSPITPKSMGGYFTIVLLAAAVVMILVFSGK